MNTIRLSGKKNYEIDIKAYEGSGVLKKGRKK